VHRRGELTLIIVQLHARTGTIVRREVRRWRRLRHRAPRKWRARRDLILVYAEKFTHVLLPIPPLTFFLHLATGLFRDLLYCSWDQTVVLAQVEGHRCKDRKRVLLLPRNQLFFALDWLFGLIILLIYGRFRVVWVLGWEGLTGVAVATWLDWSWLGSVFRTWGVHLGKVVVGAGAGSVLALVGLALSLLYDSGRIISDSPLKLVLVVFARILALWLPFSRRIRPLQSHPLIKPITRVILLLRLILAW
jgi:hypothetical protein